uniref:EB domain-containing protein n=1 Tax=Steinernema glaseri TaxID=37863 RepID=A0A1I7ZBA0_9BILA
MQHTIATLSDVLINRHCRIAHLLLQSDMHLQHSPLLLLFEFGKGSHRARFLIVVTISILTSQLAYGVRVRYTELDAKYVGMFKPEKLVGTLHDCTAMAYRGKAVGYRIHIEDDKMKCALLKEFVRFEALEDSEVRDYILTTNLDDNSCPATRNVTHLLSKPCDPKTGDCGLLGQIADYCRFVGFDIASCVCKDLPLTLIVLVVIIPASKQLELRDIECPNGQKTVVVGKGKRLCCPLAEERDGKDFCCAPEKELRDVVDGEAVCCAPGENHKKGTTLCCAKGTHYSKLYNIELCCDVGSELSQSTVGGIGCCPTGEHLEKKIGGVDICCPDGEHLEQSKDRIYACCSDGYVLKGFYKGEKKCCPADSTYFEDVGECCGTDWIASRAADGTPICCPAEDNPWISSSGDYGCCPKSANNNCA